MTGAGSSQVGSPISPDAFELLRDEEGLLGTRRIPRIYGLRTGNVVDVIDPERRGRVQVRVHAVHSPDTPDEQLPWADVLERFGGDPDIDHGTVTRLTVGAAVMVEFVNGERGSPVVVGTWRPRNLLLSEFAPNDAGLQYREGIKTQRGFTDIVTEDDENDELRRDIRTPSGTRITLIEAPDAEAGVEIETAAGHIIRIKDATNTVEIIANKAVVTANPVHLGDDTLLAVDGVVTGACRDPVFGVPMIDHSFIVRAKKDHEMPANAAIVTSATVAAMPAAGLTAAQLKTVIIGLAQSLDLVDLTPFPDSSLPRFDKFAELLAEYMVSSLQQYAVAVGTGVAAGVV